MFDRFRHFLRRLHIDIFHVRIWFVEPSGEKTYMSDDLFFSYERAKECMDLWKNDDGVITEIYKDSVYLF